MPAQPRVFLSYARSDGEALARALRTRLEAEDVPLWRDREGMEGGRDWWLQITAAIDRVDFLVLLMTPAALQSALVRREWRYARQRGVAVYPVQAAPGLDFASMPRWMRDAHFYDLDHEWRKFVADLHQRPQRVRVPFMVEALPPDFVQRPREFDRLLDQLLDPSREEPIAITTALRGAGGFGKTALACALCHDERIQNAFGDGILWVTLGERPGDLTGRVEDLIHMLSGQRPGFAGLEAAVAALGELLADRALLIVIDDAWDAAHVRPFLQGGRRCARLITTRVADVLPSGARRVDVDAMHGAEARQLLAHGLDIGAEGGAALDRLAQRLGEWPLLLKLVNGALRERVLHQGQPLDDALAYVHRALDRRGLTFFDARDAASRHAAVGSTLGLSLAQLGPAELARFRELAVFPEDADVPLATVAALWQLTGGLDEFDTDTLCERCARLSLLLALDLSARTLRLHDVVRRYLLDTLGEAAVPPLHRTLLQALRPAAGWAALPVGEHHGWRHLFHHLQAAGLQDELLATALDLHWLSTKRCLGMATGVEADLRLARTAWPGHAPLAALARIHGQSAHLLNDCRSPAEVRATLLSRLQPGAGVVGDGEVRLRPIGVLPDSPHPALLRTLGGRRGAVRACALSGDGRRVATASTDRGLLLWDTDSGAELAQLATPGQAGGAVTAGVSDARALALSADGRHLAAATGHRRLGVWNLASGARLADLSGHTDELTDCALSADGRWLLSASRDERLILWDVATGEVVHALARQWAEDERGWIAPTNAQGHWAAVLGCDMTADARLAASASADQTVIVWDLDSGQALAVLGGHGAAVQDCALSPDGQLVASVGSDRTLRVWDWASREHRAVVAHAAPVLACAFSEDGSSVATACADGVVRVWSVDGLQLLQTLTGHAGPVHDCALSVAAGLVVSGGDDGTARLWQLGQRAEPAHARQHGGAVLACAAAPDGRHAFTGGDDQWLMLWDVPRGQARTRWRAGGDVLACAISPDGALLATAGGDRGVAVWQAATGARLHLLTGHRDSVTGCAFQPVTVAPGAAPVLATVGNDRTVRLWNLATRARRLAWTAHAQWINACAFSPCGRWLVTAAADGGLRRWDLAVDDAAWERWLSDARPLRPETAASLLAMRELDGHPRSVNHVAYAPDGRLLVSASSDRSLALWDAASGQLLRRLEGHLDEVNGCSVSPDGARLASVSGDGGIRTWRLPSGEPALALHVDGPLFACAWVGNGRLAATGGRGVYLFDVPD